MATSDGWGGGDVHIFMAEKSNTAAVAKEGDSVAKNCKPQVISNW